MHLADAFSSFVFHWHGPSEMSSFHCTKLQLSKGGGEHKLVWDVIIYYFCYIFVFFHEDGGTGGGKAEWASPMDLNHA